MKARVGALQLGARPEGTAATLEAIRIMGADVRGAKPDLLVLPEALLGGYPKGADFGARIGYRLPEGRDAYLTYWQEAIEINGPEIQALSELAIEWKTALVVGGIERQGTSLMCSAFFFTPEGRLAGVHRKLMPTGSERLVWQQGHGTELPVMELSAGKVGAAICWEIYMPRLRDALWARGVTLFCAPTVDERDIWQISMRHVAYEGRCFVVSACQFQPPSRTALGLEIDKPDRSSTENLIRGGSVVVSPFGEVLAGPLYNEEGLVVADIETDDIVRARFDLDVTGHYSRPDLFP